MSEEPINVYIAGVRNFVSRQTGLYDGQRFDTFEEYAEARARHPERPRASQRMPGWAIALWVIASIALVFIIRNLPHA